MSLPHRRKMKTRARERIRQFKSARMNKRHQCSESNEATPVLKRKSDIMIWANRINVRVIQDNKGDKIQVRHTPS